VDRVASILKNPAHLELIYALLFGIPGVPCLYYGSEWGALGKKNKGQDHALRPFFPEPVYNGLTGHIAKLSAIHKQEWALRYGTYRQCLLTNRQLIFERAWENQRIYIAVNAGGDPYEAHFPVQGSNALDLLTGQTRHIGGNITLEPLSSYYWKI
jgi:glycosidase